jgi:hypothetical protein
LSSSIFAPSWFRLWQLIKKRREKASFHCEGIDHSTLKWNIVCCSFWWPSSRWRPGTKGKQQQCLPAIAFNYSKHSK